MSLKRRLRSFVRAFGVDLVRFPFREDTPRDLPPEFQRAVAAARALSVGTSHQLAATVDAVRYLTANSIAGAVVECGVWRGANVVAAAMSLVALDDTSREIFLYDTFEGMPPPTAADRDYEGVSAHEILSRVPAGTGAWVEAGIEEVRANLAATGYPAERIRMIKGKVEDTIPQHMPGPIALLRLDTDWYESTRHELLHLFPLLTPGGVLIIDDYGHWLGARQAVDEYFEAQGLKPLLNRIDYTCRLMVKSGESARRA